MSASTTTTTSTHPTRPTLLIGNRRAWTPPAPPSRSQVPLPKMTPTSTSGSVIWDSSKMSEVTANLETPRTSKTNVSPLTSIPIHNTNPPCASTADQDSQDLDSSQNAGPHSPSSIVSASPPPSPSKKPEDYTDSLAVDATKSSVTQEIEDDDEAARDEEAIAKVALTLKCEEEEDFAQRVGWVLESKLPSMLEKALATAIKANAAPAIQYGINQQRGSTYNYNKDIICGVSSSSSRAAVGKELITMYNQKGKQAVEGGFPKPISKVYEVKSDVMEGPTYKVAFYKLGNNLDVPSIGIEKRPYNTMVEQRNLFIHAGLIDPVIEVLTFIRNKFRDEIDSYVESKSEGNQGVEVEPFEFSKRPLKRTKGQTPAEEDHGEYAPKKVVGQCPTTPPAKKALNSYQPLLRTSHQVYKHFSKLY